MKKLFIAALMMVSTSAAFAGDSEPLKAILKAKDYTEAEQLLKSSLANLTSNEEKAKAYNKLMELALAKVDAEQAVQIENETNKQMGKEGNKPVDEEGLYKAICNAIDAAVECDKYDKMPNEKGKTKQKFAANGQRLYNLRGQLINGGIYFQNIKDDANAYKYLASYVDSYDYPLFDGVKAEDQNLGNIAYYASIYAYQNKEFAKAEKYVVKAISDPERSAEAKALQLQILQAQLKTHEDSLNYVKKLEGLLVADSNNEAVFINLANRYSLIGQTEKADKMIADKLAADPNNYSALTMKGQVASQRKDYDTAIEALEKALPQAKDDDTRIILNSAIGQCYFYKAQDKVNAVKGVLTPAAKQQFDAVYQNAIDYLEAAKALDVTKAQKSSWAYPLYGCYYFVKGADAPETSEAAAVAGVAQ